MPQSRYRHVLAIALLLAALPAPAAERAYTVDDMLTVESFGTVRFTPSGDVLVFEHLRGFEDQAEFSRDYVRGQLRTRLYRFDLTPGARAEPLFDQAEDAGYSMRGISPDGSYLAYRTVSERGVHLGLADLNRRLTRELDSSLGYGSGRELPWSGEQIAFQALAEGDLDLTVSVNRESRETLIDLWTARRRGDRPTSGQIGSGRFALTPPATGWLGMADARTGEVRRMADGTFANWAASGDGQVWAALREQRLELVPGQRIENGANGGGTERRLVLLDAHGQVALEPCTNCDILPWSLNWAADRPELAFVARDQGREWSDARFRIYDHRDGAQRAVDLGNLRPVVARAGLAVDIRSAWLGTRLAILAHSTLAEQDGARADWYLVDDENPRNLTASFEGDPPQLLGTARNGLLLLHGGDAWLVDALGQRTNLTADIAEPVRPWRHPELFGYLPPANPQPIGRLVLEVATDRAAAPPRLLIVDIATGRIETISARSADARFVAVSEVTGRAATIDRAENVTSLSVLDANGGVREVMRLNESLRDVVGGTPVRIDHRGPAGDARISWLLLPPGYREGMRLPTVVIVYPGSVGRESWSHGRIDEFDSMSDHILAARGYAVLHPSLPVRYEEVPREPLQGMVDEVFAAVDAAIAQGYVDGTRLAVQGTSYGGYATGGLVGLTDRFQTAIATAGIYNLTSQYGQFDIRRRFDAERNGLDLSAVSHMETSQGGMGAPPWEDPQRYLRNSPLMHVANVRTPIMLMTGDMDYVSTTQTEEFFTALSRLDRDAVMVRYYGEDHTYNSPANIRDMWRRIFAWYEETLGPPMPVSR